ncbi:probable putative transmembrane protein [Pseudoalteromonas luteoviolacea B = ATCC 29581]|nr:probable putative transmembrane protein [Pseudoalteromonas luteoviolacea B = ATCC 29581]
MKRFIPSTNWLPDVFRASVFSLLETRYSLSNFSTWPSVEWLSQQVSAKTHTMRDIRFVANEEIEQDDRYYEAVIYETGQVPTRLENWHDLFGALIWCLFPKTKSLLNYLHVQEIQREGLKKRTVKRNAITLFDECGVIVITSNEAHLKALQMHQWKNVFIEHRERWGSEIEAVLFGHANYEMLTEPFIGLTGKMLPVVVSSEFFSLDLDEKLKYLDTELVRLIEQECYLDNNKQMSPLPLLGVPGWSADNLDPHYYNNTDYFRPKRKF